MTLYKPSFVMLFLEMLYKTFCYQFLVRPNMSVNASLSQSPRLLDKVRGKICLKHHSIRIEQAYETGLNASVCILTSGIRPRWARARWGFSDASRSSGQGCRGNAESGQGGGADVLISVPARFAFQEVGWSAS